MIKWQTGRYHPIVHLPEEYEVRDFTTGNYIPSEYEFDIGRYDELRPGMYSTELFSFNLYKTLFMNFDFLPDEEF